MSTTWYFAYGSNMQIDTLCGRRGLVCHRALAARARGWRVVFDKPPLLPIGESFANLIPDPEAEAFGVLYEIDAAELAHIDVTEGVLIGNYDRVEIAAEPLSDRQATSLTAHTLISERRNPALRPSERYMALLIAGAREHGLPEHYIAALESVPARQESARASLLRPLLDGFMKRGTR